MILNGIMVDELHQSSSTRIIIMLLPNPELGQGDEKFILLNRINDPSSTLEMKGLSSFHGCC